jgi:hypothetical protein
MQVILKHGDKRRVQVQQLALPIQLEWTALTNKQRMRLLKTDHNGNTKYHSYGLPPPQDGVERVSAW